MKKICWVTSFGAAYYKNVAQYTLKNWNYLRGDKILLAEMDVNRIPFDYRKIDITNIDQQNKEFSKFFSDRKKAYRFYKKACSIDYALRTLQSSYDYIFWLDSDVIVKKSFDPMLFAPQDSQLYASIFKSNNLPDSGFISFNTKHQDYTRFLNDYLNYYYSKKILTLGNPYDNYILSDYMTKTSVRNLWKGIITDRSDASCGFIDTELENYLDHYWGKRGKIKLKEKSL